MPWGLHAIIIDEAGPGGISGSHLHILKNGGMKALGTGC
jgi:hypothetical protein